MIHQRAQNQILGHLFLMPRGQLLYHPNRRPPEGVSKVLTPLTPQDSFAVELDRVRALGGYEVHGRAYCLRDGSPDDVLLHR